MQVTYDKNQCFVLTRVPSKHRLHIVYKHKLALDTATPLFHFQRNNFKDSLGRFSAIFRMRIIFEISCLVSCAMNHFKMMNHLSIPKERIHSVKSIFFFSFKSTALLRWETIIFDSVTSLEVYLFFLNHSFRPHFIHIIT